MTAAFVVCFDGLRDDSRATVSVVYLDYPGVPTVLRRDGYVSAARRLHQALNIERPLSLQVARMDGLAGIRKWVLEVFKEIEG